MNELSLFTGAGGGLLGTKLLGFKHIGYVEIDDYCQRIIRQRIEDGIIDEAPIFGDIRTFISEGYADAYQGMVDIVTAGFPCQPFSVAGKQLGEDDERNMWPQTIDVIRRVRPQYCLLENVPGLFAHKYIRRIFSDLAESGYDCKWRRLSAAEMGAPHKRDRIWIVAHYNSYRRRDQQEYTQQRSQANVNAYGETQPMADAKSKPRNVCEYHGKNCSCETRQPGNSRCKNNVSNAKKPGLQDGRQTRKPSSKTEKNRQVALTRSERCRCARWPTEPNVGRVANGVAKRVDRLKALGNGQVPAVVATAWRLLTLTDKEQ